MAKTKEANLWAWLKKANDTLSNLHMRRVENGAGSGDPDVEGCISGLDFKIELKTEPRPKSRKGRVAIKMRKAQKDFAIDRWGVGGSTYMLIQVGSSREAARYLIPGNIAAEMPKRVFEYELRDLSLCKPTASQNRIILTAATFRWFGD